ncbi:MAG: DoxX family protein [Bacteroidota bacterium]
MNQNRNNDLALLILRIVFGGSMLYGHGIGKLMRLFSGEEIQFFNFLGIGPEISLALCAFAEFFCAILIVLGLFTRWAALPLIFAMLVAIFGAHFGDPFGKIEKALLFLAAYAALFLTGAGSYSIDGLLKKRR